MHGLSVGGFDFPNMLSNDKDDEVDGGNTISLFRCMDMCVLMSLFRQDSLKY